MAMAGAAQNYKHQGCRQEPAEGLHNRWEKLRIARVADRMTSSITVVSPETRLGEVLHLFTTMNIKTMAVYDGKEYVGLMGYSFLKEAMNNYFHNTRHVRVKEVMDTWDIKIDPCSPDEPLCEVWSRMRQTGQTHLPVLDAQGKLAGVLPAPVMDEHFPPLDLSETRNRPNPKTDSW